MYTVKINGRIVFATPHLVLANHYNNTFLKGKAVVKKK